MAFYSVALVYGGISALLTILGLSPVFIVAPVLLFFAPLPVMFVCLRYDYYAGMLAALVAAMIIVPFLHSPIALGYLIALALPGWLMGFLFLQADLAALNHQTQRAVLRWYPVGAIVAMMAAFAPVLVGISILVAPSFEEYQKMLLAFSNRILEANAGQTDLSALAKGGDSQDVAKMLAQFLPIMGATAWLTMMLMNFWLSVRMNLYRPDFPRPKPNFFAFALPRWFNIFFPAAFVLTFFSGALGLIGTVAVVTGTLCFMLLGLSVIHLGTLNTRWRVPILLSVYFFLLVQGWAIFIVALLGLVEHYAGLKRRFFQKTGSSSKA